MIGCTKDVWSEHDKQHLAFT